MHPQPLHRLPLPQQLPLGIRGHLAREERQEGPALPQVNSADDSDSTRGGQRWREASHVTQPCQLKVFHLLPHLLLKLHSYCVDWDRRDDAETTITNQRLITVEAVVVHCVLSPAVVAVCEETLLGASLYLYTLEAKPVLPVQTHPK